MKYFVRFFPIFCLFFTFSIFAQNQGEPQNYPELSCEPLNPDDPFRVMIKNTVVKIYDKKEYSVFWNEVTANYSKLKKDYSLAGFGKEDFFEYRYIMNNLTQDKLRVNLSDDSVIDSPLNDIIQDFYIEFASDHKIIEVKFVSFGEPKKIKSKLNVARWFDNFSKWKIDKVGTCDLYVPANRVYIRGERTIVFRKP